MGKIIKRILAIVGGIVVIGVAGMGILFQKEIKIMNTINKVDSEQLVYTMTFDDDYYFDEFIEKGGASSDRGVSSFLTEKITHGFYKVPVENKGAGCSAILAKNQAGYEVWGRNFDWTKAVPIIVRCNPKNGYSSISTCEFANITGDGSIHPEGMMNKMLAISALYIPMDGINEKGLCVADLQVNEGGMLEVDTAKPDLTITTAIRLLLNKAADVEEAVKLLDAYDIHASGGISHHIAIADASGNSVVVEFVEGKMVVVPSAYVTNFNLAVGNKTAGGESAKVRFEVLEKNYKAYKGIIEAEEIKNILNEASQKQGEWKTRWSIIYDREKQNVAYYFEGCFDKPLNFELKNE